MNLSTLKTPGVYIEEVSLLPPSVVGVETGIPAFVGYTENAMTSSGKLLEFVPTRITSLLEYKELFGGPKKESNKSITVSITEKVDALSTGTPPSTENVISRVILASIDETKRSKFNLYYSILWYFANGGGPCYIVSVGRYGTSSSSPALTPDKDILVSGVDTLKLEDEPTMIVVPESIHFDKDDQATIYDTALSQAASLGDRVVIMDVLQAATSTLEVRTDMTSFRGKFDENRMFGAAYYPYIKTSIDFTYEDSAIVIQDNKSDLTGAKSPAARTLVDIKKDDLFYTQVKNAISQIELILPPSPAIAAVYSKTDANRGVWKAPANVGLSSTIGPTIKIDDETQKDMNAPSTGGKAVNAIRYLTGRGTVVWGARTLMAESNEWRYINVRRFFNFVEESVKKSSYRFVFEPNDANTWVNMRAMIENFLTLQWRAGALQGAKPEHAFFVRVGLGQTMTALDILEGRLIVEIGMAVVRPAEFIVLRFMHKLPES